MTEPTEVVLSFSGGKDSILAFQKLAAGDDYRVVRLLTTVDETTGEVPMHGVHRRLIEAQADRLGVGLTVVELPAHPPNDVYVRRVNEALGHLKGEGIETVAYGDLFLEDIRRWREQKARDIGMTPIFPLWGSDTGRLARQFVDDGWKAIITGVDTDQVDAAFLGQAYDERLLAELPAGVDPCAENGEFHTFVFDGPLFAESVEVQWEHREDEGERFRALEAV